MNIFVVVVMSISLCFLANGWLLYCSQPAENNHLIKKILKQPTFPLLVLGSICCSIAYFLIPTQGDSLVFLPFWNILLFFISGFILLGLSSYFTSNKLQFIFILTLCLLNTLLLPQGFNLTEGLLPSYAEKIIVAIVWCLFAYLYFVLNGVEGIISIQSLSICFGIMLLFAIGIMPTLDGYFSCIFIALLLALTFYTSYPASLLLSTSECRYLGFMVGWLGVLMAIEGNWSCFIILSMYYIYETVIAFGKKLCFQKQFKILANNTFYSQLATAGIAPKNICNLISRINLVMILLTGFQVYAPNNYTIIIVSFFMVFWISSKITSPEENNGHILLTSSLLSLFQKNKNSSQDKDSEQ